MNNIYIKKQPEVQNRVKIVQKRQDLLNLNEYFMKSLEFLYLTILSYVKLRLFWPVVTPAAY